jgi:hypothetical protein
MKRFEGSRTLRLALICLCAGLLGAVSSAPVASILVVSVADAKTGQPLEGAQVRLPEIGRTARANWIGEARFSDLATGKYQVQVRHLGYAGSEITIAVSGDSVGAVFMLERIAALDTVKVEAAKNPSRFAQPFRAEEFDARRRMGIGHFLTDSILAKEADHELAHTLSIHLPAIRVERAAMPGHWTIVGMGVTPIMSTPQKRQPDSSALGLCPVDIYVDGMFQSGAEASGGLARQLPEMMPRDIAGVELYNIGEAPAAYRRLGNACKVLLIWTKY